MTEPIYISIILPVYNQADHLVSIVKSYLSALESFKHSFEILLVVNAGKDESLNVAGQLAAEHAAVKVYFNELAGWGRAVRRGLREAKGQLVCYTNSARTSPHVLVMMLSYALANPGDIIKANRRLRYPIIRRAGSVLYNFQCRFLFRLAGWDLNGTPKVFSRELIEKLDLQENGDLIDLEFIVKAKIHNLPIIEIPIVSAERHSGKSTTNFGSALKLYSGAFRLWLIYRNQLSLMQGPHQQ